MYIDQHRLQIYVADEIISRIAYNKTSELNTFCDRTNTKLASSRSLIQCTRNKSPWSVKPVVFSKGQLMNT